MADLEQVAILSLGPDLSEGESMKFYLTYEGVLGATQGDPQQGQIEKANRAKMKHEMRQAFHTQLKEHWQTNEFLKNSTRWEGDYRPNCQNPENRVPLVELVADLYQRDGFQYVPLVREDWKLHCALDVLVLRRDHLGAGLNAGDLDNRIKSLIDALRIPKGAQEIPGISPQSGETPFFCLLEEDTLVSEFHVRTGRLLAPPDGANKNQAWVKIVIGVTITPYFGTTFNSMFDYD